MRAWVEYVRKMGSSEYLWDKDLQLGDWLGLDAREGSYYGATDGALCATAFYAYSAELLAKTANVLGKMHDGIYGIKRKYKGGVSKTIYAGRSTDTL